MSDCVKCQQILRGSVCVNPICPLFDGDQSDRTRISALEGVVEKAKEENKRLQWYMDTDPAVDVVRKISELLGNYNDDARIPECINKAEEIADKFVASLDEGEPCGECGGSEKISKGSTGQEPRKSYPTYGHGSHSVIPCPTCQGGEDE